MKRYLYHILSILFLAAMTKMVFADNGSTAVVDQTEWQCQYCTFDHVAHSSVEAGLGYVSEGSFKFGEYTGLHEQGGFFVGNAMSQYRNPSNARYWEVTATDLGLESRSISLQAGVQGHYGLWLSYDELPHYMSDSTRTLFNSNGGNYFTLPSDWVFAGSTSGMTTLDSNLSDIDLDTKRTRWEIGASYIPRPQWKTTVNYRRETQEGKRIMSGGYYFNATEFAQPVEYTTNLFDIEAAYSTRSWQAKLSYHGSTFSNEHDALTWQNPFSPIVTGATQGQMSLPPDNQFHQAKAVFAMRVADNSRFMADFAIGRLTQDEDFLSPTANTSLSVTALPADSLDGRVDTANASVKWNTRFSEKLHLDATYRYTDRNNETPRDTYTWVTTDANIATPRTNTPYSYTRNTFNLSSDYRFVKQLKGSVGYDYQQLERTYQAVEENRENTLWASVVGRALETMSVSLRVAHSERDKDGYQLIPGLDSPENPLLRKYNMADRVRDSVRVRTDFLMSDHSTLGLTLDVGHDNYPDSDLGLTSSRQTIFGFDYVTRLAADTTANLFVSIEEISSNMSGSQLYSSPDWSASTKDHFNTTGLGINQILINEKLDIGVDYIFTRSLGEISYRQSGSPSTLPDISTTLYSIKLYGNYRLNDKMVIKGAYWYEDYSSNDWAYNNVNEATIPNFLNLGQEAPSYNVSVFIISVRYEL